MKLFHRTDAAEAILEEGFRDATGSYLTRETYTGVWLADSALDVNDGVEGSVVLSVDIPESVVIPFEWVEEAKTYREFLVPASTVNRYPVRREPDPE